MKINNVTITQPSCMTVDILDIDGETNRTVNGTMVRDRIAIKRKIELSWNGLTTSQISTILSAVANTSFSVYYLDPMVGSYVTKIFYVGDRTAPAYSLVDGKEIWKDLKFNLIEM